jgi:hypothetical protein
MANCVYDVQELTRLWNQGRTHIEIASALGCPVPYVSQLRERHKLPPRRRSYHAPKDRDPTPDEIEQRKREVRERHLAEMRAMR